MNVNVLCEWVVLMSIYDTYSLSQDIVSETFGLFFTKNTHACQESIIKKYWHNIIPVFYLETFTGTETYLLQRFI